MKAQLTPKTLKVGSVLFYANVYTDEDTNKTEIDIQSWVVRSIKKKRGSQTKHGHAFLVDRFDRNDNVYVNITRRESNLTIESKTGQWLNSIPEWCRQQFNRSNERLPLGFYTTQEAALKFAKHGLEDDLKDAKKPKEEQKWRHHDPIEVIEKEIRLVKARLTKLKNNKTKKTNIKK